ncbi:hypothetical protein Dimus_020604 [Dionaea muscipula]
MPLGKRQKVPSKMLVIPMGSDGGMSKMLRETKGIEDDIHIEGKEVMLEKEEMDKGDHEGEGTSSGMDVTTTLFVRKSRKTLFTRQRLKAPSSQMVAMNMDAMMGPASHATTEEMQRLPLRH